MTRSPSLCGVILAAGVSSRMGRDKALLPWPPSAEPAAGLADTFLGAHILALRPHCDMVTVIAGANFDQLAPVVYSLGGFMLRNSAPELGQFSSLKVGVQDVLNRGRDSAILALVDRPPVRPATLDRLHEEFLAASEEDLWGVVPEYDGKHGHPFFAGRDLIEAFLRAPLTTTARDVMHALVPHLRYVPVDDPHVSLNVNTPEDYAQLRKVTSG
ncbi:MAG TPA: nucleotidyltransferase family protein [Terriglobales bacterium]|nr:nucleotidyltransferase family protein [Terriglobales bacterium]